MHWILRFRVCIIICLAVVLISAAVIFSVLRAVLPYATGYKHEIQQEISQQIGLPVEIESIDAAINWFSPRLKLIGVSIYDEKNKLPLFNFSEAFVELDVIASIMYRSLIVADVGLIGADIAIEKLSENEWSVQGIKFSSGGGNELPKQFLYMLQNSDFLLRDSNIYYQDHTAEKLKLSLLNINMDVRNDFNNHEIKFSMNLHEDYGKSLTVVANLQGELDALDGEIYIEGKQLKIKQWDRKFNLLQQYNIDAVLDVNLWLTLTASEIFSLVAELSATDLSIRNASTRHRWQTQYLSTNFRYQQDEQGWNINVADFYFGKKMKAAWGQPVSIIASSDKQYYHLSADFLRSTDLLEITDVLLMPELHKEFSDISKQIKNYQLKTDLFNLVVKLPNNVEEQNLFEKLTFEASVNNFSIVNSSNGLRALGIDAAISYSNKQAVVNLQTKNAELEVKQLFRERLSAEILQGELVLDYVDGSWFLDSQNVQLKNSHINSFSRLKLRVSPDHKIFVDVQSDFYDAYGKYARHYLPVGIMEPALVQWLDTAVTDGYIANGSFILHGQLADFPYHNKKGVFQTQFSVRNASIDFLQEWPVLTQISASVKFSNQSLIISNAKAKSMGVDLLNGTFEFLDLYTPHLTVKTDARGKNVMLQSYIWNSPLDDLLGDSMRLFQFEGNNNLALTLEIPLDKEEVDVSVDGQLTFIDTAIYYSALGYEINAINGVIDFTEDTVTARSITALMDNNLVRIDAHTEKGAFGAQVVFQLEGNIEIDYLLQQHDWLPENWLAGQSLWSLNVEIPYESKDYLLAIKANSDLQGVDIQMSDKLFKNNADGLEISADIKVLDDGDLQVKAKINSPPVSASPLPAKQNISTSANNIVDLFAVRHGDNVWNFDVVSKYLSGKGEFTEGLSKDTHLILDLAEVDVHALFVSANKSEAEPLKPYDFPPLHFQAKKVLWDLWVFNDVEVKTNWHKHGMLINTFSLQGPAMSFDASGTWLTSWNGVHETVMQGNINSTNCGETLVGLGYQRSLDRCTYTAVFSSKWPAEPHGLSWENMKGETSFELTDGEILDVDPGAGGRLLGLLNIFKLANRLTFDFDDVTRDGFSFDTIKGDFEFVNGNGSLKNFDISAPAADINMFGSIGMVNQDYGLLMRVKPHTDTLTFAGGTLLGGVVVGAGLALIQKVFDLGIIGHNVYSITGTWNLPVIEKIVGRDQDIDDDDDDF